jgi:hypothetical protein
MFSAQKTIWASLLMCKGPQYEENPLLTVAYLCDRHLTSFARDLLPVREFRRLGSGIMSHLYTAGQIIRTLHNASLQSD